MLVSGSDTYRLSWNQLAQHTRSESEQLKRWSSLSKDPLPVKFVGDLVEVSIKEAKRWVQRRRIPLERFKGPVSSARLVDCIDAYGAVYLAVVPGLELVKIGHTEDFIGRMKAYDTHLPLPVELLCVFAGVRERETEAHRTFSEYRRHGEWFERRPEILRYAVNLAQYCGGVWLSELDELKRTEPVCPHPRPADLYREAQDIQRYVAKHGCMPP